MAGRDFWGELMPDEAHMLKVTLTVLAGGQGSRMGGSKGHLRLHGLSILQHILNQAKWPGPTLLVTAPGQEHPPDWQQFDREVCDPVAGEGPLRGILTALEQASTPIVLVVPVDMPNLNHACLRYLADQFIARPTMEAIMLRADRDGNREVEPLPIALRTCAQAAIQNQLKLQLRSVRKLQAEPRVTVVDAPSNWPPSIWTNLNDPSELNRYLAGDVSKS